MAELVVIGNACVDIFVPPHEPPPRGGIRLIPPLTVETGGNGANTAMAAARLGIDTILAGRLGDDLFATHLRAVLDGSGVDLRLFERIEGAACPTTLVVNDESGERSFVHHLGTNADWSLPPPALEEPCEIFHLAAPEVLGSFWPERCIEVARELRARGRRLSLDVFAVEADGLERSVAAHRPLLDLVDMVFPNETEARLITGRDAVPDMARHLRDCGISVVVIKRGERGAYVSWEESVEEVPTDRVEVVDTCGAGDNFVGGFLAGTLRGLGPLDAARLGCRLGTLCVARRGSMHAMSDPTVVARLRDEFGL